MNKEKTPIIPEEEATTEEAYVPSEEEQLAIKLQEIEVMMEQLENEAMNAEEDRRDQMIEQYNNLKEEHKTISKELKEFKKTHRTIYDKIPFWMYGYGILQIILYFPFLSSIIWISFSSWLITLFEGSLDSITANAPAFFYNLTLILLVYALPILGIFISWILYTFAVRSPFNRKVFRIIWITQSVLMVGMGLWVYFNFLQDILK
jgi:hypothetical protein